LYGHAAVSIGVGLYGHAAVSIGVGFRFQRREGERRHPAGRERMGSPTLQTLEEPILRMPLGLLLS
jgi:hypothetical protein